MTSSVFVEPGPQVRLDHDSLSAPAPRTSKRLLGYCAVWAKEVGWTLAPSAAGADAVVVGPGVAAPPGAVEVRPGQGIDGFRWAVRHLAFSARVPAKVVAYGATADHVIDVRRPAGERRGVAVLLHGGFWMDAWRRDLMDGIAVDLTGRGWETWNAEYRRVGTGGGWPATGDDVVAAVDAACAASGAQTVTVVGHSAGGQLALHAARERPGVVATAVSLAGLCDLAQAERAGLGGGAVRRFLGAASVQAASPLDHVPVAASVVLAHCEDDRVVPVEQSRRYAAAASAAGGVAKLRTLARGNHMSLIEPEHGWGEIAGRVFA